MIKIDGSYLEGGGQILRTAIALASIARQSVTIRNVRKGRKNPGLRPQHLEGIAAASRMCGADVGGLRMQSVEIDFAPGDIRAGTYTIDTHTAGSITLVLQVLLPIALFAPAPVALVVKGGTAVPFSPTIDYFKEVLCYYLYHMGCTITLRVKKHGFYPAGGGEASAVIQPATLCPLTITEQGAFQKIKATAVASLHLKDTRVAERMIDGFTSVISEAETTCSYVQSNSPGCFIDAVAYYENCSLGASTLGEIRQRAETVGHDAAQHVKHIIATDATVDSWMVDQIIPYMALATYTSGHRSQVRIPHMSKHAKTNVWVVEQILPVVFKESDSLLTCIRTK
jgi:RNA 3'-phosphate cyclase